MRYVLALVLLLALPGGLRADDGVDAAWAALARGGIALIRHGATDGTTGDPAGFKLDDCATQRNLTAAGRAQAQAVGELIRRRGIGIGRVLASPWCRCRDTAALMAVGPAEVYAPLSNLLGRHDARDAQMAALRPLVSGWKGPGALVLVSHGSVILPLAGVHPREGEIVVAEPQPGSELGLRVIGRIPPP